MKKEEKKDGIGPKYRFKIIRCKRIEAEKSWISSKYRFELIKKEEKRWGLDLKLYENKEIRGRKIMGLELKYRFEII